MSSGKAAKNSPAFNCRAAVASASCWPSAKNAGARESPCSTPSACAISWQQETCVQRPDDRQDLGRNFLEFAHDGCAANAVIRTVAINETIVVSGSSSVAARSIAARLSIPARMLRANQRWLRRKRWRRHKTLAKARASTLDPKMMVVMAGSDDVDVADPDVGGSKVPWAGSEGFEDLGGAGAGLGELGARGGVKKQRRLSCDDPAALELLVFAVNCLARADVPSVVVQAG